MKRKTTLFFLFLIVPAVAIGLVLSKSEPSSEKQLSELTQDYIKSELSDSTLNLHYTFADPQKAGISDQRSSFGTYSQDALKDKKLLLENYRHRLLSINPSSLSKSDHFTYSVFLTHLSHASSMLDWYYYQEPLGSTLGIQSQLPILLAEYTFYSEKDIEQYFQLLYDLPDYFASILAFEKEKSEQGLFMSDQTLDAILSQCSTLLSDSEYSYLQDQFSDRLDTLSELTPAKKKLYKEKHTHLLKTCFAPAYTQLIDELSSMKGSGKNAYGLCYLPKGSSYYEDLLCASIGMNKTPVELLQLLDKKRILYLNQIQQLEQSCQGLPDFSMDSLSSSPQKVLHQLQTSISTAFPSIENTSCTIKTVHPSIQEYTSPAFFLIPPIDQASHNTIYINPHSKPDKLELFTTLAHEGYPGHLYQTLYSYEHCPDLLRIILAPGGYIEGWATYAELYSYKLAGLDPYASALLAINKALTLNLYSTMDLGIHYYGWTPFDLYEFLSGYGIKDLDKANSIYQLILEAPGNYLKYYIGYLEFNKFYAKAKTVLGSNFSPVDYHSFLLSLGPAPFPLIEYEVDSYIAHHD